MELTLESGKVIREATENDIRSSIEREQYAILAADAETYMQCAQGEEPGEYVLEYQDGSLSEHCQATNGPISLERVISAFVKYLRKGASWQLDFKWEKMKL